MLIIFTGYGKGKTTAALGQALRAVGEKRKVLMIQFIKGPWKSGEDTSVKLLEPDFKIIKAGLGFVGILGDTLPREEHRKAAVAGLALAREAVEGGAWNMIILDEVHNAVALDLLSENDIIDFADYATSKVEHLILTGRDASPTLIAKADLVTEMRDTKHPFTQGVKAKRGVEY